MAAIALSRERADPFDAASGDEEAVIDRTVTLPDPLRLPVTGTASAVAGDELDALLAALDRDGLPAAEATSSWRGLPAFRPENAVDGDGATPWLADPTDRAPVLTVHLSGPERVTGVRVRKAPSPADRSTPCGSRPGRVPGRSTSTTTGSRHSLPWSPTTSTSASPPT